MRELGPTSSTSTTTCRRRGSWPTRPATTSTPRTGPKVFAGEYAAHENVPHGGTGRPNTLNAALAEAAFMTGLERNADVVQLASYAPLFAHVDAWQWSPNLIWFDNLHSVGTPSYYVQQLFGQHKGTTVLPVTIAGLPTSGIDGAVRQRGARREERRPDREAGEPRAAGRATSSWR